LSNQENVSNIIGPHSKWEPVNISISIRSTWKRLQSYHTKYGDTFDSVITDILDNKSLGAISSDPKKIVLELLRELGGKAKTSDISRLAKSRYPDSQLHQQVAHKLMRVQIWGYIQHDRVKGILVSIERMKE
jgi:hypothetical protein